MIIWAAAHFAWAGAQVKPVDGRISEMKLTATEPGKGIMLHPSAIPVFVDDAGIQQSSHPNILGGWASYG